GSPSRRASSHPRSSARDPQEEEEGRQGQGGLLQGREAGRRAHAAAAEGALLGARAAQHQVVG
uniref:Uncharacterized protein n=1 Tax=Aegilops tauschii subsp. strangulata TaxID=200361 RepID=A0A453E959_AEGTS